MKEHSEDGETIPLTVHARPQSPCKGGKAYNTQGANPWKLAVAGAGLILFSLVLLIITVSLQRSKVRTIAASPCMSGA